MTRRRPPHTPDPVAAARATVAAHVDALRAMLAASDVALADHAVALDARLVALLASIGHVRPRTPTRERPEITDPAPCQMAIPSPAAVLALAWRELSETMRALDRADETDGLRAVLDGVRDACDVPDDDVTEASLAMRRDAGHVTTWALGQRVTS